MVKTLQFWTRLESKPGIWSALRLRLGDESAGFTHFLFLTLYDGTKQRFREWGVTLLSLEKAPYFGRLGFNVDPFGLTPPTGG
jgi:hypothetical protein